MSSPVAGAIQPIPIAALNQYVYCSHRCWRIFCAGEFVENHYTIKGTDLHQRVHTVGENQREETWQIRAIWLKSEQYGLIGKSDLIEEVDGNLYPIEYKRGHFLCGGCHPKIERIGGEQVRNDTFFFA